MYTHPSRSGICRPVMSFFIKLPGLEQGTGHKQEKAHSQQRKCHQQQDLCGKAIKEAENEARNAAVNVALIKKNLAAVKGP